MLGLKFRGAGRNLGNNIFFQVFFFAGPLINVGGCIGYTSYTRLR